jgi:hypothetical protein
VSMVLMSAPVKSYAYSFRLSACVSVSVCNNFEEERSTHKNLIR